MSNGEKQTKGCEILKDYRFESANTYSPLVLAYIGDAVYETYVRCSIVSTGNMPVHKLHKASTGYVKAKAQSDLMEKMLPLLTEEETAVFKRGRNAKSATSPKHADIVDYRRATGFEALIGYLYISDRKDRIVELLDTCMDFEGALNHGNQ